MTASLASPSHLRPGRGELALVVEPGTDTAGTPCGTLVADAITTHCPGVDTRVCTLADADALATIAARASIAVCPCAGAPATRFDALARLLLLAPELPVIVLAPPCAPDLADEALRVGACDVLLTAPGYLDQVPIAVRKNLRLRSMHASSAAKIDALTGALDAARREHRALQAQVDRLESLSTTDPLTGIGNRRLLDERLSEHLAVANRHDLPLCVLSIDLDGLKAVNDVLGHAAGDEFLRTAARAMVGACRGSDIAARTGGDEFVLLLPHSSAPAGETVAKRVQSDFERLSGPLMERWRQRSSAATGVVHVVSRSSGRGTPARAPGLSIGIAARVPGTRATADGLLAAADRAMYQAKSAGGNRWLVDALPVTVVKQERRAAA